MFCTIIVLYNFFIISTSTLNVKMPKIKENFEKNEHLKFENVRKICRNSTDLCKSNDTNVCATRLYNGKMEYQNFENSCFMFIDNMCYYYDNEYSIVSDGTCESYFKSRRHVPKEQNIVNTSQSLDKTKSTTKAILREEQMSTLYEVDTAFDFHKCPFSCPNVYSPVCVGVNRGHGPYYKFFTFSSHCAADLYYCKNWREFSPPPGLQEMVKSSPLSWSYCAANRLTPMTEVQTFACSTNECAMLAQKVRSLRLSQTCRRIFCVVEVFLDCDSCSDCRFIQFARFTEMTTSMGHYGWLAGDYSPTHILEPHERRPGYGK